jgi:hypothetical protein
MTENSFILSLEFLGNFSGLIILPLIIIIAARKIWQEKKEMGDINVIRLIMMNIYILFYALQILETLYENTPLRLVFEEYSIWASSLTEFSIRIILIGALTSFAIGLVTYANQWDTLYFAPIFLFGGMILLYLATGFALFFPIYIIIAAVIGLIFLFYTGFRIKDNGSLGVAILFSFQLISITVPIILVSEMTNLISFIFALILGLGYFKPYGEEI